MSCLHVSARLWVAPILVKKPDDDGALFLGQGADGRSDIWGVSPTTFTLQSTRARKTSVDGAWAARPLELIRERGRPMLILEFPGSV